MSTRGTEAREEKNTRHVRETRLDDENFHHFRSSLKASLDFSLMTRARRHKHNVTAP